MTEKRTSWSLLQVGARTLLCIPLLAALSACSASMMRSPLRPSVEDLGIAEQPAGRSGDVAVSFFGTTTLLFESRDTAVLVDAFFSRPSKWRLLLGRIRPDSILTTRRLSAGNGDAMVDLSAIFVGHADFDHVLDAPWIATRTGALLLGPPSVLRYARELGVEESKLRRVRHGMSKRVGPFELSFYEAAHAPDPRCPGEIESDVDPPAAMCAWRVGSVYSVLVRRGSQAALVQGTAGFEAGALDGVRADVVYLSVGRLGWQDSSYAAQYWKEVVCATGARRVILVHWDDFTRSLDEQLLPPPYVADDARRGIRWIKALADADGIELLFPRKLEATDPFINLAPSVSSGSSGGGGAGRTCAGEARPG